MLTGGYRPEDFPADPRVSVVADLTEFADVEDAATTEERMRFGFLHYYLLDANG